MKIAVGFGRKTGYYLFDSAAFQVFVDDLFDEISIICHISSFIRTNL